MTLDPVLLAIVQGRFDHVSRHMGEVMLRTSRSPIFNQSHDFSCFITDGRGRLISQADGIPVHTGGGSLIVEAILRMTREAIREGDVFISSDPYVAGGNHLPDWVITRPVFAEGALVAFACNRAHQSDIGGGVAGTYNPMATEIFHEGIRLPVLRLVDRGTLREDVWDLLLLNSRCPDLLDGDLRAMLGSTEVGRRKLLDIVSDYGRDDTLRYVDGILDHAELRMRMALAELPDGEYLAEDCSDNDCFESREVCVRVRLVKRGEEVLVDFTGTDPQIRGFKNSSFANTRSATYVALTSFLDPQIPRNDGTYRPVTIEAPLGSLVNPRPPAPLTMCTVLPTHEIMHAIWRCLAQADPSRACAGWGKICHSNSAGLTPDGSTYVMYHWGALPGGGAVDGRDGFNQIGPLNSLGKLTVPNCEAYEQLYPVRFVQHEFRTDAAGAGTYRGGTGVAYVAEALEPAEYAFRGEGACTPSGYGVAGGRGGAAGALSIEFADGTVRRPPQFSVERLGPLRMRIDSPAGGGFGPPEARDPERVLRDVRDGVVSAEASRCVYLVALAPDGRSVDRARTQALRAAPDPAR